MTLKSISKKKFDELPNNEKRILIAKDVLAQLESEKFRAKNGTYYSFGLTRQNFRDYFPSATDSEIRSIFRMVSGQGQPNLSHSFFDDKSVQTLINDAPQCHVCAKGSIVLSFLKKFNKVTLSELGHEQKEVVAIFGPKMWQVLETAFEGWDDRRDKQISLPDLMKNIIQNNGFLVLDGKRYGKK